MIFEKYIKNYDFWGFSDIDIIWGKVDNFIDEEILNNYDIISSRKNFISGHFTLFRNNKIINQLFRKVPNYEEHFNNKNGQFFDEIHFDKYLKKVNKVLNLRIYWAKYLLNVENNMDSHQDYHLDRWLWKNGKLTNTKTNQEVMYLHFINWKNSIKKNGIQYNSELNSFFISYNKIHLFRHTSFYVFANHIKNLFFGYWRREKVRTFKYIVLYHFKRILKYLKKK